LPYRLRYSFSKTNELFDILPNWIPLYFSNYKLNPWHGGCAWIFQKEDDSPVSAFFQLGQAFKTKDSYFYLYRREELIAHELSHVGRMVFNEPKFEEMLAYQTSHNAFRRYFGPLVEAAWESTLFVFVLILILFLDLSALISGYTQFYTAFVWIKLIPIAMLFYSLIRLWKRHSAFSKCLKNLKELTQSDKNAHAILYRLTDQEVFLLGNMNSQAILQHADEQTASSLRWRLIKLAYLH
jgi:hypothetical protein